MNKYALITGGAGFLGAQLCKILIEKKFTVLCLGRTRYDELSTYTKKILQCASYHRADLSGPEGLTELNQLLSKDLVDGKKYDELYFFNLAWSGENGLSDLSIAKQFDNVLQTQRLYNLATGYNFHCFVHSGTMEEKFAQRYTALNYKTDTLYNRHVIYALAKLYSRYSLKLTRNPVTDIVINSNAHLIGPGDRKDSFLQQVIISHIDKKHVLMSSGEQLFDVINVADCAMAYLTTARNRTGLDEYWIGSNSPRKLYEYVDDISSYFNNNTKIYRNSVPFNDVILGKSDFDASKLYNLGFTPTYDFISSVNELTNYLLSQSR